MIKKVVNLFLISAIILGNFFIFPAKITKAAGSAIHINEVAPSESGGQDWIEFYIDEAGDYSEYVAYERETVVKTFPSEFILDEGNFIILHINQEGEDEIIDENENGYIDLYSSDLGLIGTDDVITIKNNLGEIIDALCFSNLDGTWSGLQNSFNETIEAEQWTGTIDGGILNENECVNWSGGSRGYSMGRDEISTDTDNENEAKNDWTVREYQTMGFANRENSEPEILEIKANPDSFILGGEESILFTVKISDEDGLSDIESVSLDLTGLGGEIENIFDSAVLDGIYTYEYYLPSDINFGNYEVLISIIDSASNEVEDSIEIEILEPVYSDQIIINEILPNPEGDDSIGEFIELYNKSSETVNLENWKVGDTSTKYIISNNDFISTEISGQGYFTIYRNVSKISLNNTGGETISLYQPNKEDPLYKITYSESAPEGQSYNLTNYYWQWSIKSTPDKENEIVLENHKPEVSAGSDIEAEINKSITFDGSKSSDADKDKLSFEWDFGDGKQGSGSKTTHSYIKAGSYTVKLTVSDDRGGKDSDTLKVKIIESGIGGEGTLDSESDLNSEKNISGPFSKDIIITEVLPNPEGSDTVDEGEFIEIYNKGNKDVDLEAWQVDDEDGGSSPYTIKDKTIKSGEYLVFWRGETKLSINNSDEKARLIYPDGKIASEVYYEESAKEGYAYALDENNDWQWTDTPTPGEANTISGIEDESNDSSSDEESNTTSETSNNSEEEDDKQDLNIISIEEARNKEKNSEVKVKGIVISEPGLFSKKNFYIQDETSGIQIYFSKEDFSKLELGDEVIVTGKRSESGNEKKINISNKEDVQILGHKSAPQPKEIKTGDLKEDYEGQLVKIIGEIVKTSGNVFYLDDGSGQAKVYINTNTGIEKPEIKKGNKITILGIESETSSGYRVLPRYQSDIRDGDDGILTGITNGITGNIPQAGANIIILFVFALLCTTYFLLPSYVYELKNKH